MAGAVLFLLITLACYSECSKTDKRFPLDGLYPAVYSPFGANNKLNVSVVPEYAEHLKRNCVDGVLVAGTSGEGPSLTLAERKALLDAWLREGKSRGLNVIMQVGGQNLPDVLELALYAEQAGADAIMTLPELYFKPGTDSENVGYVRLVGKAAPSLPVLYYHHPAMSGVNINVISFYKEAVATIPNFGGMKCDFATALKLLSSGLLQDDHALFMTSHTTMASNVLMGFNSSMSAISSLYPGLMLEIAHDVHSGDLERARLRQTELNERADAITLTGEYVTFGKVTMNLIHGIDVGHARHARKPITREQIRALQARLATIDAKYGRIGNSTCLKTGFTSI